MSKEWEKDFRKFPEKERKASPSRAFELAVELESSAEQEKITEKLKELLTEIEQELSVNLTDNVTKIYREMEQQNCLARVESLSRVMRALKLGEAIAVGEKTDSHYANSVIPKTEGIQLAFGEGMAPGPARILISFGKTLVGFKTDNLKVEKITWQKDTSDLRDLALRSELCRHVSGKLNKEDIRSVVIRIARKMFPDELLTEKEKADSESPFIFRGFSL